MLLGHIRNLECKIILDFFLLEIRNFGILIKGKSLGSINKIAPFLRMKYENEIKFIFSQVQKIPNLAYQIYQTLQIYWVYEKDYIKYKYDRKWKTENMAEKHNFQV